MQDLIQTLTADLRLSLLVLGAVVIAALILWELVQRWRARKADAAHLAGPDDIDDVLVREARDDDVLPEALADAPLETRLAESPRVAPERTSRDEPTLDLPSMSARDDFDDRWASLVATQATQSTKPPSGESLRAQQEPVMRAPESDAGSDRGALEPDLPDEGVLGPARELTAPAVSAQSASPESASPESASPKVSPPAPSVPPSVVVRIEWPPEDQRRVMGLRVVGKGGEKFTGASLRQALQGEGFVFGEMDIFHRPLSDGRVVMSAASLTQPGTFNLDAMDTSLFRGLNLFAVLPGPMPGRDAVDKLLLVGHTLAQRVRGELQDGRGQPLTEARLAEMRREAGSASH